jgi:cbb3-type cytochrome oxidase maturation protein
MSMLWLLVPISLALGGLGLAAFFWSMGSGQYDDLAGAAERILFDEDDIPEERPAMDKADRVDRRA